MSIEEYVTIPVTKSSTRNQDLVLCF